MQGFRIFCQKLQRHALSFIGWWLLHVITIVWQANEELQEQIAKEGAKSVQIDVELHQCSEEEVISFMRSLY